MKGARSYIAEIRLRLKLQESVDDPESQFELGEYLITGESGAEEGVKLAFEAYRRRPELLARMKIATRAVMVAEYIYPVLGIDLSSVEGPEHMGDLLVKYRSDVEFRAQMQTSINAKSVVGDCGASVTAA